jgi:hypothetical protein
MKGKLAATCLFFLIAAGCVNDSPVSNVKNEKEHKEVTKTKQNEPEETKEFSYLDGLPKDKYQNYQRFAKEKHISYLEDFAPEEIVLIYMHSVAIADDEAIYALTYNDGTFRDFDEYQKQYERYLLPDNMENAFMYRHYDSIKIAEEHRKDKQLAVMLEVNLGIHQQFLALGLKKQVGVWKLHTNQLLKHFKEKTK